VDQKCSKRRAFVLSMSKLTVIMLQSSLISNMNLTINFTKKKLKTMYYDIVVFYIFFQQISILNFLNMLHKLRFSPSKCRLFHNATFFWLLYYSNFTYRVC
jgi:hypothetical protein